MLRRTITQVGSDQSFADYYYTNGNKLQEVVGSNGTKVSYVYTGDFITEQNYYENNVLKNKEIYTYDTLGKMIQCKTLDYERNEGFKVLYTYNLDGTVNILGYKGDFTNQTNQTSSCKVFLFSNGDVQKTEFYEVINGVNHTKTRVYTYDDKNDPYISIVGRNKIKKWETMTSGNSHNNLTITYTTTENSSSYTNSSTYTYNNSGFPKTVTFGTISHQYFYQ